jgi:hypothetical protein
MAELMFVSGPGGTSGGGDEIIDLPFNATSASLVAGYVYLDGGTLTTESRVLMSVSGNGNPPLTGFVNLVPFNGMFQVAQWSLTTIDLGVLQSVSLGGPVVVAAGWYELQLGVPLGSGSTVTLRGVHLELTPA